MEEFKGTKGKWKAYDFKGRGSCIDITLSETSGVIAQVYSPTEMGFKDEQTEEHKANAQLIAAAPELLDACIEALRFVSCEEPAFDILNKAITKALGKQDSHV